MHSHAAEIVAEARLEEAARGERQRLAGRAHRLAHRRRQRDGIQALRRARPGALQRRGPHASAGGAPRRRHPHHLLGDPVRLALGGVAACSRRGCRPSSLCRWNGQPGDAQLHRACRPHHPAENVTRSADPRQIRSRLSGCRLNRARGMPDPALLRMRPRCGCERNEFNRARDTRPAPNP